MDNNIFDEIKKGADEAKTMHQAEQYLAIQEQLINAYHEAKETGKPQFVGTIYDYKIVVIPEKL